MLGRTDRRGRLVAVLATFVLLATLVGVRLAYWQVAAHDQLVNLAQQQLGQQIQEQATRGSIYDRTGVLLATTVYRDRLAAYRSTYRSRNAPASPRGWPASCGSTPPPPRPWQPSSTRPRRTSCWQTS